jgi:GT2 family glycosyltransferase
MACLVSLLRQTGGFCLTTRGCGEDDYIQYRTVVAGYRVRFAPRAIVYQRHRSELSATLLRLFEYGTGAMRVVWQLSAEEASFWQFLRNTVWLYLVGLRRLAGAALRGRFWHVLFTLVDLAGVTTGVFLRWGWSAHLTGKPAVRARVWLFSAYG